MKNSAGWRTIGGKRHYFRSLWEIRYAQWLQYQKEHSMIFDWQYEPKTFWFTGIRRGVVSYKPDFKVITNMRAENAVFDEPEDHYWVEVKGYMDPKSLTKIKRFHKYSPKEELRVVDGKWFARYNQKLRLLIKDWESGVELSEGRFRRGRRFK